MGTLAVVELPLRSGLPKDKIVNTFAFAESNLVKGTGNLADEYATALARVYNATEPGTGVALSELMSAGLSRTANACAVKLYDITDHLDGSPHGSPYAISNFTLVGAVALTPLPEEVALCATLEAKDRSTQRVEVPDGADPDAKPDRPRQRYTGRVYIGPLVYNGSTVVQDANGMSRPGGNLDACVRAVLKRLADEVDTTSADEASLGVWSRKSAVIRGVEYIRTDNAFDTQRRRGASPTSVGRVAVADLVPDIELAS